MSLNELFLILKENIIICTNIRLLPRSVDVIYYSVPFKCVRLVTGFCFIFNIICVYFHIVNINFFVICLSNIHVILSICVFIIRVINVIYLVYVPRFVLENKLLLSLLLLIRLFLLLIMELLGVIGEISIEVILEVINTFYELVIFIKYKKKSLKFSYRFNYE